MALNWPTPDANVINDGENPETFLIRREQQKARGINGNGMGMPLAMAAKTWPTPTTRDWKDTGSLDNVPENCLLGRMAANWSTPRASDAEKGGPNQSFGAGGIPLPAQCAQWMTPRVATGAYTRDRGNADNPRMTLEGQTIQLGELWTTPRAQESNESWETKQIRNARHLATSESSSRTKGVGGPTVTMQAQALASFLPAPPTSTAGEKSSASRRSLNPLFVEWLMGWPPGWTASECSATAASRFRSRMRFALSQLALPPEASPSQLNLFGGAM